MAPEWVGEVATQEDEFELLEDVWGGLSAAISQTIRNQNRHLTDTERQKLTDIAIRQFDLPITTSWYLAGRLTHRNDEIRARSGSQPRSSLGEGSKNLNSREKRFCKFFKSGRLLPGYSLSDVWYTHKQEFLKDYYNEHAPEEYQMLYINSTTFRGKLNEVSNVVSKSSDNNSLASYSDTSGSEGLLSRSDEDELRYLISDIHMGIANDEELQPSLELVTRGTDVIEIVLTKLTETNSLDEIQQELVYELEQFFFEKVWKYPCLKISATTATGPRKEELAERRLESFNQYDQHLATEIEQILERCMQRDLIPEYRNEINQTNDSKQEYLHTLTADIA